MTNIFKSLFIPSGEQKELIAYETWEVRWKSFHVFGSVYANLKEQVEVFTTEEDAISFKNALRNALKLMKCDDFNISIKKV